MQEILRFVFLPKGDQVEGGFAVDYEVLAHLFLAVLHENAPRVSGLETLVDARAVVFESLIDDFENTDAEPFSTVFEDIVQNGLSHALVVKFVDFGQHVINHTLDRFSFHVGEICRNEVQNVGDPVLPDRSDLVQTDFVFYIRFVSFITDILELKKRKVLWRPL